MSLFHRLVIGVAGLLLLFSIGIFAINVNHARQSLLDSQRMETANMTQGLSLALVQFIEEEDWTSARTLLQATSDGSFVNTLRLEAVGLDEPLVVQNPGSTRAPAWFQALVALPQLSTQREISGGWSPLGAIMLEADNSLPYNQLWKLGLNLLLWLAVGMVLTLAICVVGFRRLLTPLHRLSRYLETLQIEGYAQPIESTRVRELQGITLAVNQLSARLNDQFEAQTAQVIRLQRMAEQDAVSRLGNRAYLTRILDEWLAAPESGALVILRIDHLSEIYRRDGFEERDNAIRAVGHYLSGISVQGTPIQAARLSAEEFALIVPDDSDDHREELLLTLLDRIDDIVDINPLDESRVHHARAGVVLREPGLQRVPMLSKADSALREAIESDQRWVTASREARHNERSRGEWRMVIDRALAGHAATFVAQPVLLNDGQELHRELFMRLREGDEVHMASTFLPIARHFGIGAQMDRYVLNWLSRHGHDTNYRLAVNLTQDLIGNDAEVDGLIEWLKKYPTLACRLDLEVTEDSVLRHIDNVQRLFRVAWNLDGRGGIDRFARDLNSLPILNRLRPDYVKIDQTFFVRDDVDNEFLRSLCMAAHQIEALVIVTRVESEAQRARVSEIGADGYQGYLAPAVALPPGIH
ncbi:bifunctional diguanylate cyclase/phosphodiesterase [Kushneria indalinina]|uniref:Diguanylate cyclase/phosphodiesterase n=1 Tax=Kushneria indalinina DSM 14324 TaxID=1122140 RepID=A0A3D9DXK6_9GAMM|nr:EAL domain-containing protein [Kushneria indalinina]REC95385.1 diguanylate cyclase/phosphodiesterase [Kushneria indalinina DSM 14324]